MAQQPCRAVYLSGQLKDLLDGLGPSDKLRDWVDDMVDVLKENMFAGQRVKKNVIPDYYKRKYGVNNLYRYRHPEGFRSCYTLVRKDSHVCPVILDVLSHPEYDRIFGY